MLDQFLVSKTIISNSPKYPFKVYSCEIISYPELIKGDYNTPIRYGRPSSSDCDPQGFSDHLPVKLVSKANVPGASEIFADLSRRFPGRPTSVPEDINPDPGSN